MEFYYNPCDTILLPLTSFPSYYTSFILLTPAITGYIVGNYVIGGIFTALAISSIFHHRRTYNQVLTSRGKIRLDYVRVIDIMLCIAAAAALIVYFYDRVLLWVGTAFIVASYIYAKVKYSMYGHALNHLIVAGIVTALLLT